MHWGIIMWAYCWAHLAWIIQGVPFELQYVDKELPDIDFDTQTRLERSPDYGAGLGGPIAAKTPRPTPKPVTGPATTKAPVVAPSNVKASSGNSEDPCVIFKPGAIKSDMIKKDMRIPKAIQEGKDRPNDYISLTVVSCSDDEECRDACIKEGCNFFLSYHDREKAPLAFLYIISEDILRNDANFVHSDSFNSYVVTVKKSEKKAVAAADTARTRRVRQLPTGCPPICSPTADPCQPCYNPPIFKPPGFDQYCIFWHCSAAAATQNKKGLGLALGLGLGLGLGVGVGVGVGAGAGIPIAKSLSAQSANAQAQSAAQAAAQAQAAQQAQSSAQSSQEFSSFQQTYQKSYSNSKSQSSQSHSSHSENSHSENSQSQSSQSQSSQTQQQAQQNFQQNQQQNQQANSQNTKSDDSCQGVTQFSDMSLASFLAQFTGAHTDGPIQPTQFNPPLEELELTPLPKLIWQKEASSTYAASTTLPKIRYQGSCGACYAFTVADLIASQNSIERARVLGDFQTHELSVQYLMDCGGQNASLGCKGGRPAVLVKNLENSPGIPYEYCYKYQAAEGTCQNDKASKCCHRQKVKFSQLIDIRGPREKEIFANLLNWGPVIAIVGANEQWMFYNGTGVIKARQCDPNVHNHAVMIVGYNYNTTDGKVPYYMVRNSWGPDWGTNGYAKIEAGKNTCGVAQYLLVSCTGDCRNVTSVKDLINRTNVPQPYIDKHGEPRSNGGGQKLKSREKP